MAVISRVTLTTLARTINVVSVSDSNFDLDSNYRPSDRTADSALSPTQNAITASPSEVVNVTALTATLLTAKEIFLHTLTTFAPPKRLVLLVSLLPNELSNSRLITLFFSFCMTSLRQWTSIQRSLLRQGP